MNRYRVNIRGENYSVDLEGQATRVGFYTARFVVAESTKEAEALALRSVRNDALERGLRKPREGAAFYVEDILEGEETSPDFRGEVARIGFSLFDIDAL